MSLTGASLDREELEIQYAIVHRRTLVIGSASRWNNESQ